MSYTFLLEQGGESSAECFSDIPAYVLSNLSIIVDKSYCSGSATGYSRSSPSGTTSELLMDVRGIGALTSCAEDSRAKTSAALEKELESREREAVFGEKWQGWFAKWHPTTSLWKTRQYSLLGGLDEFSGIWPSWGIMQNGACWELPTLADVTIESEFGFLPTPRASGATHGICWKRALNGEHRSQLEDYLGMLSRKNGGQVVSGRTVNADFQDWLMGWPVGWTDLRPLEMGSFQRWRQSHGTHSNLDETI